MNSKRYFQNLSVMLGLSLALVLIFSPMTTAVEINDTSVSRHYDPGNIGHKHECKACKALYHQPGDHGYNSPGSYICPNCGYNNSPVYQGPTPPQPPQPPAPPHVPSYPGHNPSNPPNSNSNPDYQRGYRDGYAKGFQEAYAPAFQKGRKAGEEEGRREGERDGFNRYVARYENYTYTKTKLADLIKRLNIDGRSVETRSSVELNPETLESTTRYTHYNSNSSDYRRGYNDGMYEGRREGEKKGYWDGRSETYDRIYKQAFQAGREKAEKFMHYKHGRKMSIADQFQAAMESHRSGDHRSALLRLHLILIEEPSNSHTSFRNQAIWYCGDIHQKRGNTETALSIFILHYLNNPRDMKEDTTLNIAMLLLDVKTGGFLGIGSTRYYERSGNILTWWLDEFRGSGRYPEAMLTLGEAYEKMKNKDNAREVYQQLKEMFPQTQFAVEAEKRLKKLDSWWR